METIETPKVTTEEFERLSATSNELADGLDIIPLISLADSSVREDLRLVGYARRAGWDVDLKRDAGMLGDNGRLRTYESDHKTRVHCSGETYSFDRPGLTVWFACYDGPHWNLATYDGELYGKPVRYETLKEALDAGTTRSQG